MLPQHLAFIDVETTGLSPIRDNIIDIGIVRVDNGKITETFDSLVNPNCYLPPEITLLTGISSQELEHAPSFYALKDTIRQLLEGAIFVAHNARFDLSFCKSEFSRVNESFSTKVLCTAKLSRKLYPRFKHHNLDSIISRFSISCDIRHRAFPDAKALWDFYQIIQQSFDQERIIDAIQDITRTPAHPPGISAKFVNDIPQSPGVYIFYDSEGAPLYIGKSINIKDRVLSHFHSFAQSGKEAKIFQSITSIETKKTSGELGALLLESELIKTMQPLLNRQLRKKEHMIALLKSETSDKYYSVTQKYTSEITIKEIMDIIAIYKTEKQMKQQLIELADTHKLCHKLLGIEQRHGACFRSQLEQCHGACIGKEIPAKYNLRFTEAFTRTKVKQWPFTGPISIQEGDDAYLVYQWCYLGKMSEVYPEDENLLTSLQFDYDTYKILSSYLLRKAKPNHIHVLQPSSDKYMFSASLRPLSNTDLRPAFDPEFMDA